MNKKNLQGIFLGAFILILLIILVYAAETATLGSPLSNTNYTSAGTLNFSCNNVSMEGVINATLFYNISGGAINVSHNLTFLVNASANQSIFGNVSVNLTGLSDATTYNMTCFLDNDSAKVWSSSANITIDATAPNVSIFSTTVSRGNYSGIIIINTSVTDATIGVGHVYFNITNFSTGVQVNYTKAAATGTNDYNITVDTSKFTDGQYTITVWANDSLLGKSNSSNNFTANMNNSESINVTFDNTAPTATYTCSPSTVSSGDTVTCTCSPSDLTSGINESQTSTTTPSTTNTGVITETCNFVDNAGNSGSQTATYTVEMSGSGTSSSGGGGGTTSVVKSHSFSEIIPEVISTMKNFKSDVGIKQIAIEVNNKAQNVKLTVTKYDEKPAIVTKEKTGEIYKYLEIKETNIGDKLSKATVTIQVEKTWVSDKGLDKDDISMFKFDETSEEWNELTTTYVSEDNTNYVYEVELTSFSYFTIAGESKTEPVVEEEKSVAEKIKETGEQIKAGNLFKNVWFWVILVIVLVLIGYGVKKNK
tara:strand:+ start:9343 stop:10950 length:1608 start_codon:yes stop_codon:yes gene_type:complete